MIEIVRKFLTFLSVFVRADVDREENGHGTARNLRAVSIVFLLNEKKTKDILEILDQMFQAIIVLGDLIDNYTSG